MSGDDTAGSSHERLARLIESNRALPLGRYLREVARASMIASVLTSGACGDSELGRWIDPEEAILPVCEASSSSDQAPLRWRPTQGLNPSLDYDFLAVYGLTGGPGTIPFLLDSDGQLCWMATDPQTCELRFEESEMLFAPRLTITAGDEVRSFVSPDDLLQFLGTVDTPQEALLVALFDRKTVPCGVPTLGAVREVADGYEVIATAITSDCDPVEASRFLMHVAATGTLTELRSEVYESTSGVCIGRRPAGLSRPRSPVAGTRIARHFAEIATLEAAAVTAFDRLTRELEWFGAPASLVADARKAANDEVRHAAVMTKVARHFGAEPRAPSVAPVSRRDPMSVAIDNATEGSIRETFGALTGCYQAMAAQDGVVREAMGTVAEDELFHAELSGRIDAFLSTLLTEEDRDAVGEARREAIAALRAEMSRTPRDEVAAFVGLPSRDLALAWIDRLERDVWSV